MQAEAYPRSAAVESLSPEILNETSHTCMDQRRRGTKFFSESKFFFILKFAGKINYFKGIFELE